MQYSKSTVCGQCLTRRKNHRSENMNTDKGEKDKFEKINEKGEIIHLGIVFALSNSVDGVYIHVMSKYDGKAKCHQIEESPSGKRPAYLLMKKHYTMNNVG